MHKRFYSALAAYAALTPMNKRFYSALAAYAALALMAAFTLDGLFRTGVWILLGGLAVKTCIAWKAGW